jgi:hypothetical protein
MALAGALRASSSTDVTNLPANRMPTVPAETASVTNRPRPSIGRPEVDAVVVASCGPHPTRGRGIHHEPGLKPVNQSPDGSRRSPPGRRGPDEASTSWDARKWPTPAATATRAMSRAVTFRRLEGGCLGGQHPAQCPIGGGNGLRRRDDVVDRRPAVRGAAVRDVIRRLILPERLEQLPVTALQSPQRHDDVGRRQLGQVGPCLSGMARLVAARATGPDGPRPWPVRRRRCRLGTHRRDAGTGPTPARRRRRLPRAAAPTTASWSRPWRVRWNAAGRGRAGHYDTAVEHAHGLCVRTRGAPDAVGDPGAVRCVLLRQRRPRVPRQPDAADHDQP